MNFEVCAVVVRFVGLLLDRRVVPSLWIRFQVRRPGVFTFADGGSHEV